MSLVQLKFSFAKQSTKTLNWEKPVTNQHNPNTRAHQAHQAVNTHILSVRLIQFSNSDRLKHSLQQCGNFLQQSSVQNGSRQGLDIDLEEGGEKFHGQYRDDF